MLPSLIRPGDCNRGSYQKRNGDQRSKEGHWRSQFGHSAHHVWHSCLWGIWYCFVGIHVVSPLLYVLRAWVEIIMLLGQLFLQEQFHCRLKLCIRRLIHEIVKLIGIGLVVIKQPWTIEVPNISTLRRANGSVFA